MKEKGSGEVLDRRRGSPRSTLAAWLSLHNYFLSEVTFRWNSRNLARGAAIGRYGEKLRSTPSELPPESQAGQAGAE